MGYEPTENINNDEELIDITEVFKEHLNTIAVAITDIRNINAKEQILLDKALPKMIHTFVEYVFANMEKH